MAESENRAAQDIGTDEASTISLRNVADAHTNITTQALQQTQIELAAINAVTVQHLKDMAQVTANGAQLAMDRMWNVDEQGYTASQILGSPFSEAIKAAVAAAVNDATKSD